MPDNPPIEYAAPAEVGRTTTVNDQSGGVNIDAQRDVAIGGDVVGRDQIKNIYITALQQEPKKVPMELPPRAVHFTDRKAELQKLLEELKPGTVITLWGPGGIGKTALAAEALWKLTNEGESPPQLFPDGVLFHSFYNQSNVTLALEHFALSFGEKPNPTAAIAAQRALAGRKALLVLDGAEAADNLEAALAVRAHCGVLITSRSKKDAAAEWQTIPPLETEDAVELLQAWGGKRAADEQAVRKICELVGGLPLAVRLAGRYLAMQDEEVADYTAWLEDTPLKALDLGTRRMESVPLLLDRSLKQVSASAVEALAVVGILALAPFEKQVVAEALRITKREAGKLLGELVQYGLLTRREANYQVSHALVHTYAQRRLAAPEGTIEALGNYFDQFAQMNQNTGAPGYEKMDMVRPHIMTSLAEMAGRGMLETVVHIAHVLTRSRGEGYLQIRGYWNDEHDCLTKAIDACVHLMENVGTNERLYWSHHLADLEFGLGDLLFYRDQYDQAANTLYESLDLYGQLDDCQVQTVQTLLKLGEIHLNKREFDRALECFQDSLTICVRIGETGKLLASIYLWLGRTYRDQESYQAAQVNYEKSLAIYQLRERDEAECADVLIRLAVLAFDKGEEDKAKEYLRQSEELVGRVQERSYLVARVRRELANQYLWRKNFEKAEELHRLSLQDFEAIGTKRDIAWSVQNLGDLYFDKGEYPAAEEAYQEALKYFDELGILHGKGYAYDHLGQIRLRQNRLIEARRYLEKALDSFRQSGLTSGVGWVLLNLGDVERAEGKPKEAMSRYNDSWRIWEERGYTKGISTVMKRMEELSGENNDTNPKEV